MSEAVRDFGREIVYFFYVLTLSLANSDRKKLTLTPFWQGTVRSNEVKAVPR